MKRIAVLASLSLLGIFGCNSSGGDAESKLAAAEDRLATMEGELSSLQMAINTDRFEMLVKLRSIASAARSLGRSSQYEGYLLGIWDACMDFIRNWDRCTEDRYAHLFEAGSGPADFMSERFRQTQTRPASNPLTMSELLLARGPEFEQMVNLLCNDAKGSSALSALCESTRDDIAKAEKQRF